MHGQRAGDCLCNNSVSAQDEKNRRVAYYLEPWEYLVFNGLKFMKFDGNHRALELGVPVGAAPMVRQGMNAITYRHEGANKALVSILLEDAPVARSIRSTPPFNDPRFLRHWLGRCLVCLVTPPDPSPAWRQPNS